MSAEIPPSAVQAVQVLDNPLPGKAERASVRIHQHTMLLYFWPIWFFGFIFAGLTLLDNHRLALLPSDGKKVLATELTYKAGPNGEPTKMQLPEGGASILVSEKVPTGVEVTERVIARSPFYGVIYFAIILVVIFFTNVPLRGLTAYLFLASIVIILLLLYSFGQLRRVAEEVLMLDVRINLGGYVLLSTAMLILWSIAFFLVDHRIFIEFLPGQIKVVTEVGEGEKTYDSAGVEFLIQPTDPFRNQLLGLAWLGWALKFLGLIRNEDWGLGTGDLIVTTGGADRKEIHIANVIGLTEKRKAITEMLKKQRVVQARD